MYNSDDISFTSVKLHSFAVLETVWITCISYRHLPYIHDFSPIHVPVHGPLKAYACTMRQSILNYLWDIHINKIDVEVSSYWIIVLYLMG